jgi:hypothetical protein
MHSGATLIALSVPLFFDNKVPSEQFAEVFSNLRGLQRDVVYLDWPIAHSYMSPSAGRGGELRGLSQRVRAVHMEPKQIWRSNSIINLEYSVFSSVQIYTQGPIKKRDTGVQSCDQFRD